jgi:hypothetical protein
MRRNAVALSIAVVFVVASPVWADDQAKPSEPMTVHRSSQTGTVISSQSEQVAAIITAVDQDKREVSLQGANGRIENMHVGDQVKNFAQLKVGDAVLVRFYRGLALTLQAPDSQSVAPQAEVAAARAVPGDKPAGAMAAVIRGTVTIQAIDPKTRIVTLVGPEGREFRVKAGPSVRLSNAKVGDKVFAEYGEGLAISVRPTTPPAQK